MQKSSVGNSGVKGLLTAEIVLNIVSWLQYIFTAHQHKENIESQELSFLLKFSYIQLIFFIIGASGWPPLTFLSLHYLFVLLLQISLLMSFFASFFIYSAILINYYGLSDSTIQSNEKIIEVPHIERVRIPDLLEFTENIDLSSNICQITIAKNVLQ